MKFVHLNTPDKESWVQGLRFRWLFVEIVKNPFLSMSIPPNTWITKLPENTTKPENDDSLD